MKYKYLKQPSVLAKEMLLVKKKVSKPQLLYDKKQFGLIISWKLYAKPN
jgi:hypothetical protein